MNLDTRKGHKRKPARSGRYASMCGNAWEESLERGKAVKSLPVKVFPTQYGRSGDGIGHQICPGKPTLDRDSKWIAIERRDHMRSTASRPRMVSARESVRRAASTSNRRSGVASTSSTR